MTWTQVPAAGKWHVADDTHDHTITTKMAQCLDKIRIMDEEQLAEAEYKKDRVYAGW